MAKNQQEAVQRAQRAAVPHEDISKYAGQWVAVHNGHVIASDTDPRRLRANPLVGDDDTLVPVREDGSGIFIA